MYKPFFRPCTTSHKSLSSFCHKQRPADEGQRGEEPVGLDVEAEHELEVGRPVGHEGEGAEAGRHVRQHQGRERHRRRHRLPGHGQGVRLVAILKMKNVVGITKRENELFLRFG